MWKEGKKRRGNVRKIGEEMCYMGDLIPFHSKQFNTRSNLIQDALFSFHFYILPLKHLLWKILISSFIFFFHLLNLTFSFLLLFYPP